MNQRLAPFALAVAIVGIVWLSNRVERSSGSTLAPEPPAVRASVPEEALATPPMLVEKEAAPIAESMDRREPVSAPATPARDPKHCEIRGRFLFASGEPAAGVEVRYEGETHPSAADGTFSILYEDDDNPNIWAKLDGYAGFQWEWFGYVPGQVIDVGDVVVERGGTIRARIVDREGRTLSERWSVHAQLEPKLYLDGRDDDSRVHQDSANAEGVFVLEHVRCGRVGLRADADIGGDVDGPTVQVRDGEETEAEIRYVGPDLAKRITVSLNIGRLWWLDLDPEIHLSGPGIEPRTARAINGLVQTYSFDDLPPGPYLVEVDDPRLSPWRADGVTPGTALTAEVKGSSSLVLRVQDEATGSEFHDYGAVLRFRNMDFFPNDVDLFGDGVKPAADGVIDGIVPGDFTLVVTVPGRAPGEVLIEGLAPGECRQVLAKIGKSAEIGGTLAHADGRPVPRTEVALLASDDWNEERPTLTETDEQGRFEFRNLAPNAYVVRASVTPFVVAAERVVIDGGFRAETRLILPPEAYASGRVKGPDGASFEGMSIVLQKAIAEPPDVAGIESDPSLPTFDVVGAESELSVDDSSGEIVAALDADGSFRIGPVRPGAYSVLLQLPQAVPVGSTVIVQFEARREIGRVELEAGENLGRVLDAKSVWPGTLQVHVRGDAPLLSGAVVVFQGRDGASWHQGYAELGQDGEVQLAPLFPGRYGILVGAADETWTVSAPELSTLAAGGSARCEIDVVLATGEVRILDRDTGDPLADRSILLVPQNEVHQAFGMSLLPVDTDHTGLLRATLPQGVYTVRDAQRPFMGPDDPESPTLRWTSVGPDVAEVALPRPAAEDR